MRVNAMYIGPSYEKLWTDSYIRHVSQLNSIIDKSPPQPVRLKNALSVASLQRDASTSVNSSHRLYLKLLRMSPTKK